METYTKKEKNINSIKSSFQFNDYIVKNVVFELNNELLSNNPVELDFKLDTDFYLNELRDQAMVEVQCIIFEDYIEKGLPFYIKVDIVGNFSLNGDFTHDEVIDLCRLNATAILFPYLRAFVSNLTALAGVPILLLPTVNIQKFLED